MERVEVFKTNVETGEQAASLVTLFRERFPEFTVNFDLTDCDRIFRVKASVPIPANGVLSLLHATGFTASLLTDEIPAYPEDFVARISDNL